MRRFVLCSSVLGMAALAWLVSHVRSVELRPTSRRPTAKAPVTAPFGIDQRIPWTTSRVVGSPDPPFPYRVRRAFPKLKVACPIGVAQEPGTDSLLLLHQHWPWGGAGRILRIKDDPNVENFEELLSLDGIAYGVAFHPDYRKNGYLYVGSNGPLSRTPRNTRVTRYTIDRKAPHRIVPGSAKVIIEWDSDGHNGGDLAFGPDGMLYITSGDGTSDSDTALAGQDLSRLRAKVLRIDVDHVAPGKTYAVPSDNPFVGMKGVRPETWAYGFRNPWRLHIDKPTGDVWVGQNGQDLWEQVYLVKKGANYGWSVMEGSHPFYLNRKRGPTPISKPIADHPHSEMRSLTGGVVYRGSKLPELRGTYIYSDFSTGRIWGLRHEGGRVTFHKELARTTLQVTGFGLDAHGELLIADHGSGYYYLEPTPKEAPVARFPGKLSETGLFASVKDHRPAPGLIPYSVNAPLWSDGATKERFMALPGTSQIDFTTSRGWNLPEGAVLVKTFSLDVDGQSGPRRIETRLLTKQLGQWAGYTYLWNEAGTDAELVDEAGMDKTFVVRDSLQPDGKRKQTWHYPSRVECMACHSRAANYVLGLTEVQMNKVHDYGGVSANQLRTLEHLGVFHVNCREHVEEWKGTVRRLWDTGWDVTAGLVRTGLQPLPALPAPVRDALTALEQHSAKPRAQVWTWVTKPLTWLETSLAEKPRFTTGLPRPPAQYRHLADPYDRKQPLEARARAYLHANCAQCHVEAGGGNALMELEATTARDKMRIFDVRPQHDTFGIPDARLIAPGDPARSVLLQRIARRGPGQMPPLATAVVDREAVEMMREWIKQQRR